jgi:hypothetical protein
MNDLSPQARALLRAARPFDEPSQEDHRRVRSSVLGRVGAGAAVGLAATVSTSTLAASTGTLLAGTVTKIGIAVLLAGGISTGAYFAVRSHRPPPAPAVAAVQVAPAAAPEPQPVAAVPETQPTDDVAKAADAPAPALRSKDKARPRVSGDIEGEVQLLEIADADLRRGDTSGALAALAEHAAKYPTGALRQERDGMNVVALCKAGRQAEGRAAAEKFLSRGSKSALASRIRAACGMSRGE